MAAAGAAVLRRPAGPAVASKLLTLLLVHDDTRILLGEKLRGFGVGKWNGFGGKVEPGETIEAAAIRELKEESGLDATSIHKRGVLHFEFKGEPQWLEVHVYGCTEWTGEPTTSDEMRPQWYDQKEIPYDQMWLDDIVWYPKFFRGESFTGYFLFEGQEKVLGFTLEDGLKELADLKTELVTME